MLLLDKKLFGRLLTIHLLKKMDFISLLQLKMDQMSII